MINVSLNMVYEWKVQKNSTYLKQFAIFNN